MSDGAVETDVLTGFLTRRAFDRRLRGALEHGTEDAPVSLAFFDLDHFKRVNDQHGHAVGDEVIRAAAEAIRNGVGEGGTVGRYGGEEFAVLLPGTEREQAFLAVESIRASMDREIALSGDGISVVLRITMSGGVASFPTDAVSEAELVRKADQALYRAKKTGRNKVCIAQQERMATKTTHYTLTQLERLSRLSKDEGLGEAALLREALDDLLIKYKVSEVET